jgi:hypothetical protein
MAEEQAPTSVRLTVELKERLKAAAEKANQSIADYIATAVEQRLLGTCPTCGRSAADTGAAPYWDQRLSEWCAALPVNGVPVVIGTDEGAVGRRVYLGKLRRDGLRESSLMLRDVQGRSRAHEAMVIPRSAVRVWDQDLVMHELLVRLGYFPVG